jgi:hypothetical protein
MPDKRPAPSSAAGHLQELADQELALVRERHRARDIAVRQFDTAATAIVDAEQAIGQARDQQGAAISALLGTGLEASAVASMLQLDPRRVRELRSAKRSTESVPALAG